MLDRESERHWTSIKESYPSAVVFYESDGLVIVGGRDLEVLAKEFDIRAVGRFVGFVRGDADSYVGQLIERGYKVAVASAQRPGHLKRPGGRSTKPVPQMGESLAVEPTKLFDAPDLDRVADPAWLRRVRYEEMFERFKEWLRVGDQRSLRDYGEVFVYPVHDWYEVDLELTSMCQSVVLLLAAAAHAMSTRMPCRVVEPKPLRRAPRQREREVLAPVATSSRIGQLSFDDLLSGWSG